MSTFTVSGDCITAVNSLLKAVEQGGLPTEFWKKRSGTTDPIGSAQQTNNLMKFQKRISKAGAAVFLFALLCMMTFCIMLATKPTLTPMPFVGYVFLAILSLAGVGAFFMFYFFGPQDSKKIQMVSQQALDLYNVIEPAATKLDMQVAFLLNKDEDLLREIVAKKLVALALDTLSKQNLCRTKDLEEAYKSGLFDESSDARDNYAQAKSFFSKLGLTPSRWNEDWKRAEVLFAEKVGANNLEAK